MVSIIVTVAVVGIGSVGYRQIKRYNKLNEISHRLYNAML